MNEGLAESLKNVRLHEHITGYEPSAISIVDERRCFLRSLARQDKAIALKGDHCIGGKRSKERLAVLLASNVIGTECLPPFVIRKDQHLKCLKDIIPLTYEHIQSLFLRSFPKFCR